MKRHFENLTIKAARAIRHWWLYIVCGILCIAAGVAVFAFPMDTYVTLGILFGILMLVTGVAQLIVGASSGNFFAMRGYLIVGGILDLILGIFLCANPAVTLVLMPILLGIWMLYHSFMIRAFSGDMETFNVSGNGWVMAGGVLLMLLSIFILVNPLSAGIATVVLITGLALILFGILLCALGVRMKDIHRQFDPE